MAFKRNIRGGQDRENTVIFNDLSGGLNMLSNPMLVDENELTQADNIQYGAKSYAAETRDAITGHIINDGSVISLGGAAYLLHTQDGILYGAGDGKIVTFPVVRAGYVVGLLRCSDFTWFEIGVFRVNEVPERCSDFVGGAP